jgi:type II secretory ATPase GspE/PulE/Tfp pilus assembly ATPase PilB-like protein
LLKYSFKPLLPNFTYKISQKKVYTQVAKEKIQRLFNGLNSTILVQGSSKSGKSYTLRGLENQEKGLLINSVEVHVISPY